MTVREDVADLKKRVEELTGALIQKSRENNALSELSVATAKPNFVTIKNYSTSGVVIPYELHGVRKSVLLEPSGRGQIAAIPFEVYEELRRTDNALIRDGYIARTDEPISNPNIIESIEDLLAQGDEEIRNRINLVTNADTLYRIYDFIYKIPAAEKTAKDSFLFSLMKDRLFELIGVKIIDSESME